jgi:hypothetical protein
MALVGLAEVTWVGLAAAIWEALAAATLAALVEATDSMVEVMRSMAVEGADSMVAVVGSTVVARDFTAEGMGSMAAGLRTGAMATTGIMETGTMATTAITGTTGTMDIGAGVARGILGTGGVGVIRGTVRTTAPRMVVTMAAIIATQSTQTAIPAVQK